MLCGPHFCLHAENCRLHFPKFSISTVALFAFGCVAAASLQSCNNLYSEDKKTVLPTPAASAVKTDSGMVEVKATLDTVLYKRNIVKITNGDSLGRWPVKATIPNAGAILPLERIVASTVTSTRKRWACSANIPPLKCCKNLTLK